MSDNKVTRQGNKVIKEFASHFNFVAEEKAYTLLKGRKMTPVLYFSGQDVIEHEYVEGPTLLDAITSNVDDPVELQKNFRTFYNWYKQFYDITGMNLFNADFGKFIYGEEAFVYVDFEHSRPGNTANDIARLLVFLYLELDPNTEKSLYLARLFFETGREYLQFNPGSFNLRLRKEFQELIDKKPLLLSNKDIDALCAMVEEACKDGRANN